jgi:hypothetical protein
MKRAFAVLAIRWSVSYPPGIKIGRPRPEEEWPNARVRRPERRQLSARPPRRRRHPRNEKLSEARVERHRHGQAVRAPEPEGSVQGIGRRRAVALSRPPAAREAEGEEGPRGQRRPLDPLLGGSRPSRRSPPQSFMPTNTWDRPIAYARMNGIVGAWPGRP